MFKKIIYLELHNCSPFFCLLSSHVSPTLFTWHFESLLSVYSLLYADLFTNLGRSFRFPGLILCFCCCYCYYFMSHSVHFAKNHTSYVLTACVLSSFAFLRLLIGYLILSNRGKKRRREAFIASTVNSKCRLFTQKLGIKLDCTLDIVTREIFQNVTPIVSFSLFKSLQ